MVIMAKIGPCTAEDMAEVAVKIGPRNAGDYSLNGGENWASDCRRPHLYGKNLALNCLIGRESALNCLIGRKMCALNCWKL